MNFLSVFSARSNSRISRFILRHCRALTLRRRPRSFLTAALISFLARQTTIFTVAMKFLLHCFASDSVLIGRALSCEAGGFLIGRSLVHAWLRVKANPLEAGLRVRFSRGGL